MASTKNEGGEATQAPRERTPVEEVALVVPETDDQTLPVMTFRAWFLGIISCSLLIFLNTFFSYRTQPLTISAILMQIAVLPEEFKVFGWGFSLNPGPFNMKEHVIITVFANCGVSYGGVTRTRSAPLLITCYHVNRILGYGWAGMLRKYLVEPAEMWWPSNLLGFLSLERIKVKRLDPDAIFLLFLTASFLLCPPGYLFPILTFFSWVCWVWPHSITAQQIGSGYHGLGVGAFTLDWAGISAYHGSPLVTPWFSILNVGAGFIMFIYIIVPVCYWKFNTFDARKFPIFSNQLFTSTGHKYDTNKILTPQYDLNIAAYDGYGKLYLSPLFALSIGSGFARFTATLTHVALFHGRDILRQSKSAIHNAKMDVHARLMKNYKQVPEWWFLILLIGSIALSIIMCFVWKRMCSCHGGDAQPGYDIIAQFIIGYVLPGKPINLLFKIYGRISTVHALSFLTFVLTFQYHLLLDFQLVGTLVAGTVNLAVAWWMTTEAVWTWRLYRNLVWLFLIGAVLPVPVWVMSKIFPEKKWIPLINIQLYLMALLPSSTTLCSGTTRDGGRNTTMFCLQHWMLHSWGSLFFALQNENHNLKWWGTKLDHCPLATCPTQPGIVVEGCPVFQ
ncbi:hypothetical protein AAG906_015068 [Vitis piasezkii]